MRTALFVLAVSAIAVLLAGPGSAFQSSVGHPQAGGHDNQRHGGVVVTGSHDRGVGTSVHGQAHGDLWRSRDGNSRVHADGHYDRVIHGPARGAHSYGGHINFEHKF